VVRADHRCRQGRAARCVMSHALDMRRHRQEWRLRGFETGPLDRRSPVTGAGSSFDDAIVAVSCGAARSCAAAVTNGDVPLYDGTTWSASSVVDRDGHLTGLSCPTSRFCVTVDDAGEVLTYDEHGQHRSTWTMAVTSFRYLALHPTSAWL